MDDINKRFENLRKSLTKKRKRLICELVEKNNGYKKQVEEAKMRLEKSENLGIEEDAKIAEEEIITCAHSFANNEHEISVLANLLSQEFDVQLN